VTEQSAPAGGSQAAFLALYDSALPHVYGYLLSRCGRVALAEELTAETFLAAVDAVIGNEALVGIPWVVGVARHKLADHWRRESREERGLRALADDLPLPEDPWDAQLDAVRARETLERLALTIAPRSPCATSTTSLSRRSPPIWTARSMPPKRCSCGHGRRSGAPTERRPAMADPFEALRAPLVPVDPDPSFAAHLRARVEQALDLPRGAAVSDLTLDPRPTPAAAPVTGVVPYLAVADARRALEWYVEAFAARHRGEPIVMPDGRVGHAELEIAGGVLMLADEFPDIGVAAPRRGESASVTLHISVDDVDALTRRAVAAGATLERPPADYPYGRNAVVRDPFGHRWLISTEPSTRPRSAVPRHGDVVYASLWVPDVERATTSSRPSSAGGTRAALRRAARSKRPLPAWACGGARSGARCSCASPSTTSRSPRSGCGRPVGMPKTRGSSRTERSPTAWTTRGVRSRCGRRCPGQVARTERSPVRATVTSPT
jgi:uncharacterized glyoxalase superfamily protein PhnB/DNA-directed RNA polymerase specialized sigma24 family protein